MMRAHYFHRYSRISFDYSTDCFRLENNAAISMVSAKRIKTILPLIRYQPQFYRLAPSRTMPKYISRFGKNQQYDTGLYCSMRDIYNSDSRLPVSLGNDRNRLPRIIFYAVEAPLDAGLESQSRLDIMPKMEAFMPRRLTAISGQPTTPMMTAVAFFDCRASISGGQRQSLKPDAEYTVGSWRAAATCLSCHECYIYRGQQL